MTGHGSDDRDHIDERPSRRNLLRLAGAGAAGAFAAATIAGRADAAIGGNVILGQTNDTQGLTTEITGNLDNNVATLLATNTNTSLSAFAVAVRGDVTGTANVVGVSGRANITPTTSFGGGTGVEGQGGAFGVRGYTVTGDGGYFSAESGKGVTAISESGTAIQAMSYSGTALFAISTSGPGVEAGSDSSQDLRCVASGRIWLQGVSLSGVPSDSKYEVGELIRDTSGNFWVCVAHPSGSTWRKIGGPSTAGTLHPIPPTRVYDSRRSMTPMTNGVLASGGSRTITVKDRRNVSTGAVEATDVIPAGVTAVEFNLTIANTVGTNGYLAINPGIDTVVHASHINWFGAAQINANTGTIPVDSSRQVTVIAGGTSTSCHFIVDITGYYL